MFAQLFPLSVFLSLWFLALGVKIRNAGCSAEGLAWKPCGLCDTEQLVFIFFILVVQFLIMCNFFCYLHFARSLVVLVLRYLVVV